MKIRQLTTLSAALLVPLATGVLGALPAAGRAAQADFDAAVAYKDSKCAMCHKLNAEKYFDPAKSDDALVGAIMKGAKGEQGPAMPGYEAKGMSADHAKALVAYMKSLRQQAAQ
jgi:mono/diheme cytochrome c family protein